MNNFSLSSVSVRSNKGSYLQKLDESENANTENTNNSQSSQQETNSNQTKAENTLPSYEAIAALENANRSTEADDLYNARWSLYRKDLEQSNAGIGRNEFNVVSQRSLNNSQKIITTTEDAKIHITDFAEKLKEELINQGKFSSNIEKALEYVLNNFKWDVYLEKCPDRDANCLEWEFLRTLASAVDKNSISTIFY